MRKSWQAEQEGRFPDLGSWYWNGLCKGSDAIREVPEVRLVGNSRARSGTYTELARSRWAAQQIENGAPVEAVRAAVTGQLAMHEPVSKATLPHKGRPKKANPKAALSVPSRKRIQHR